MSKGKKFLIPPLVGLGNDYSFIETIRNRVWQGDDVPTPYLPVSIIIPVYNRKEILAKTLAGIRHQNYPLKLIEVIIADDGSNDNPEEIIPLFSEFFSIKYVSQEDLGFRAAAVRNLGVSEATHNHFIFLDCDMLPEPDLVRSMMEWLHISPQCILIGHRRFVCTDELTIESLIQNISPALTLPNIDSENKIVKRGSDGFTVDWREKIYQETNKLKEADAHVFRTFCSGNVGLARTAWDSIGGFDEDFKHWGGEDTEFGFRAYNQGFYFIPESGAMALHQEPPGGDNETDRLEGRGITHDILIEKCPSRYRPLVMGRKYEIPKVSVFMPAYNCESFIDEAISSVLNQTYSDFELVITNDGGTDNTESRIIELAKLDDRIRFFPKDNGGIGSACNHILGHAKGEYALQLDGDDIIAPDTIEKMVEILDTQKIGFVYGDAFLVDGELKFTQRSYSWSVYDRHKMIDGGMHIHPPRMFRMRDYHRSLKYDETLENAVDYDFFLKLAEIADGYHLQRGLYLYRRHGRNTSDTRTEIQTKNSHVSIEKSLQRLGLREMLELEPDEKNPRKLHVKPVTDMVEPLAMDEYFRRFGISEAYHHILSNITISDLFKTCSPETLARSSRVTNTSTAKRRLRIGPFKDPIDLVEVRDRIKQERGWNLHHQSVSSGLDSALYIVTGHFTNESAAQNASSFVRGIGLQTEIVANGFEQPYAFCSVDTLAQVEDMVSVTREYSTSNNDGGSSDVNETSSNTIKSSDVIPEYEPSARWHYDSGRLWLQYSDVEIWFEMPKEWSFEDTHPDLFRLAEFVLLSPHEPDILEGWVPSRLPGFRPGLAFSGGVDSAAAMCLMPERTLLFYHERAGFESQLNHENAYQFIRHLTEKEGRPVVTVKSNHELLRTMNGKSPGFTTDYACAVHVILLADHYGLDSIATGMPLENSYLFHGQRFRNFGESRFWKKHAPLFDRIGLSIYQPVMGCSEIINRLIVDANGYGDLAQSCLRAKAGTTCGECWKCFRKNSILGKSYTMSNEITTFLSKQPLKMAASTIYSIQRLKERGKADPILNQFEHIRPLLEENVSFLDHYYAPALDLLPEKYKSYTAIRLSNLITEMEDLNTFESFNIIESLTEND